MARRPALGRLPLDFAAARADNAGVAVFPALYLLAVNAIAFAAMAGDKQAAIGDRRRIPERTLLQLALIGGALGAVAAQQMLRHKTRKQPFRTQLWLIAAAWTALLWWAAERIA